MAKQPFELTWLHLGTVKGDRSARYPGRSEPDCRGMIAWIARLLAETAWPPASDIWLKDPSR